MSINIEQVLASLDEDENPEGAFLANLQEKTASAETQEKETPETPKDSDMEKIAEADAQGRIMARAFFDELEKIGVLPTAEYPADPGAVANNPAVEVGRGELAQSNVEGQSAANQLIAELVAANKIGAGEVATPAGVYPVVKADPNEGNMPLAADIAKAKEKAAVPGAEAVKTGALKITKTLYNKYFGEDN
jgi:hypothetical protein